MSLSNSNPPMLPQEDFVHLNTRNIQRAPEPTAEETQAAIAEREAIQKLSSKMLGTYVELMSHLKNRLQITENPALNNVAINPNQSINAVIREKEKHQEQLILNCVTTYYAPNETRCIFSVINAEIEKINQTNNRFVLTLSKTNKVAFFFIHILFGAWLYRICLSYVINKFIRDITDQLTTNQTCENFADANLIFINNKVQNYLTLKEKNAFDPDDNEINLAIKSLEQNSLTQEDFAKLVLIIFKIIRTISNQFSLEDKLDFLRQYYRPQKSSSLKPSILDQETIKRLIKNGKITKEEIIKNNEKITYAHLEESNISIEVASIDNLILTFISKLKNKDDIDNLSKKILGLMNEGEQKSEEIKNIEKFYPKMSKDLAEFIIPSSPLTSYLSYAKDFIFFDWFPTTNPALKTLKFLMELISFVGLFLPFIVFYVISYIIEKCTFGYCNNKAEKIISEEVLNKDRIEFFLKLGQVSALSKYKKELTIIRKSLVLQNTLNKIWDNQHSKEQLINAINQSQIENRYKDQLIQKIDQMNKNPLDTITFFFNLQHDFPIENHVEGIFTLDDILQLMLTQKVIDNLLHYSFDTIANEQSISENQKKHLENNIETFIAQIDSLLLYETCKNQKDYWERKKDSILQPSNKDPTNRTYCDLVNELLKKGRQTAPELISKLAYQYLNPCGINKILSSIFQGVNSVLYDTPTRTLAELEKEKKDLIQTLEAAQNNGELNKFLNPNGTLLHSINDIVNYKLYEYFQKDAKFKSFWATIQKVVEFSSYMWDTKISFTQEISHFMTNYLYGTKELINNDNFLRELFLGTIEKAQNTFKQENS